MVSALAALGLLAAGCSDDPQRGFAVPEQLCGVAVPSEALSKLLPASGDELRTAGRAPGEAETGGCEVSVDGNTVLTLKRETAGAGRSAWNILSYDHGAGQAEKADGDKVAYTAGAAVSLVRCTAEGRKGDALGTYIVTVAPGRKDAAAMKDLASGYTAALEKLGAC
ncbi:hypothetical protein [Streptomyces sp. NPDC008150]|uniref:hypothetical protein n=1 Tax=Streptomyces sp. NPDC008150 TaxID=3364816 RepID=UPI0036EDFB5E